MNREALVFTFKNIILHTIKNSAHFLEIGGGVKKNVKKPIFL